MPASNLPNIGLFYGWGVGESGWGTPMNLNLLVSDTMLSPAIEDVVNDPPASPAVGQMWQVDGTPTGAFVGHEKALAIWDGAAWQFVAPKEGFRVYRKSNKRYRVYRDAAWHRDDSQGVAGDTLIRRLSDGRAKAAPGVDADDVATVSQLSGGGGGTSGPTNYQFVNVVGTAHTLTAADLGKIILFDSISACQLVCPEVATEDLSDGFWAQSRNKQGGVVDILPQGSDVVVGSGTRTVDSRKLFSVYKEADGLYVTAGDLQEPPLPTRDQMVVVLVVDDLGTPPSSLANTRTALVNAGFDTNNIIDYDADSGSPVPACDVIFIVHAGSVSSTWSAIESAWQAGTPVLLGHTDGSVSNTTTATTAATSANVSELWSIWNGDMNGLSVVSTSHYITNTLTNSVEAMFTTTFSPWIALPAAQSFVGTELLRSDPAVSGSLDGMMLAAIEAGTLDLSSNPTPARSVAAPVFSPNGMAYSATGGEVAARCLEWLVGYDL